MEGLPDEMWSLIFSGSTRREGGLCARDLCSLALVSKRCRRISSESASWKPLVDRDFGPQDVSHQEYQVQYKTLQENKRRNHGVGTNGDSSAELNFLKLEFQVNCLKLELEEHYHFLLTWENALDSLEKSIKSYHDKLEELLYSTPILPVEEGTTSSERAKTRRNLNADGLSGRQAKKAKTLNS